MTPRRPLVVVTQAEGAGGPVARSLAARGAAVLSMPAVAIEPAADLAPLDKALEELERFDWIIFTSRHAVQIACSRPAWQGARGKDLSMLRVAAVGTATAGALAREGVTADLLPGKAGAAELARAIVELARRPPERPAAERSRGPAPAGAEAAAGSGDRRNRAGAARLRGVRFLWPRSQIARRELPEALEAEGADVVDPVAYATLPSGGEAPGEFLERLDRGEIDAVTFLSPSSARGLAALLGRSDLGFLSGRVVIASIGPTTSEALRGLGAAPEVESAARTADDLAGTLLAYLGARPKMGKRGPGA